MKITQPGRNAALLGALALMVTACGSSEESETTPVMIEEDVRTALEVKVTQYELNAERGRALFVSRGCVLCHSVNGVGGRAAYPLDKETFLTEIDPVNFSARMWRGAPEMLKLQEMELGYQISISAQDIADLAAFAGDIDEQGKLLPDQVPQNMQDSFLNEFIWVDEEYNTPMDEE